MSDENISVEPSVENGNVPIDTPNEQLIEPEVTPEVVTPEPQLFDLPDGRKVDAETLAKEFKDNFLPEFTRKSQELAELKKVPDNKINPTIENPYARADYIPKNYEEVISEAEKRALDKFEARQQAEIDRVQALENEVSNQLTDLKKIDPNLNENSLFLHANEYKTNYGVSFPDLKSAYQHMKDVAELTKNVQQTTAKNIAKRQDPVSTTQGKAIGTLPSPSQFSSAREYLKAVQGLVK